APDPAAGGGDAVGAPASPEDSDSSGTNVQETGIDEPDIVKSQGSIVYALAAGGLQAIGTGGDGGPHLRDTLELSTWNNQLLVAGDRVLVIGYVDTPIGPQPIEDDPNAGVAYPDVYEPSTILTEVDVSDPSHLRVVRTETVDGLFVAARLNGTTARIVISSVPRAIAEPKLRGKATGWRPSARLRKAGAKRGKRVLLGGCRSIRRPRAFSGLNSVTVLTIDMEKGLPGVDSDSVLSDAQLVYGSNRNLYVATQRWLPAPESADELLPSVVTALHKFDASKPGETSYDASGSVQGSLLSQWSMSDHDGSFRVASTDEPLWWDGAVRKQSESRVTVLREVDGRLVEVGRVDGLGVDQRIYAVRFIGDVGYVVTFRQIDPLYTLDLSAPANPRVAGELEVPGYSAYLHPVGEDLLLGVGQDAGDDGRTTGAQLSLFDVSDPSDPRRLAKRHLGEGASSAVEYDHHGFLWWTPAKLAVLPLTLYDGSEKGEPFTGAVGFNVGRAIGIDEAGRTGHRWRDQTGYVSRSLVVRGRLFTLSDLGLAMNALDDLGPLGWAPFPAPGS
ncbi:MAG TPA: beta-propeller domain-containing protein, partial [Thermoleophilaceae bacterium]|nr:beta-propeller domain-containing protein [Thermoleophilaceae bacterium]